MSQENKIPDLYATLTADGADPVANFHGALLQLFDRMMNEAGITDEATLNQLARARSKIDIELKNI